MFRSNERASRERTRALFRRQAEQSNDRHTALIAPFPGVSNSGREQENREHPS